MGLDNGITLITRQKLNENNVPPYIHLKEDDWYDEYETSGYHYEICYWRKCWNIRNIVFDLDDINSIDCGMFELEIKHIVELRTKLIEYLLDIQKWQDDYENGQTIWDADDMIPHLAQDIITLKWLAEYMTTHRTKVEFYDSY